MLAPERTVVLVLAAILLTTSGPEGSAPQARADRPNFVFLLSDDQRHDTIHALGNEVIQTPHMDRLAMDGFVFTHAFVMGSTSPAVCMPSRAMLHSGRSLWRAPSDLKGVSILPEILRQAGYETFGTGKWHNTAPSFARGFSGGEAIFFGGMSNHLKVPIYLFEPGGRYPSSRRYTGPKFSTELFADAAVEFLRTYRSEEPFFLYVAFTAPHDPRMAPEPYADMYDPAKIPLPPNFLPEHPFDNGELRIRDEMLAPFPRTPEAVRRHIADYYAMISHLDFHVGRVLKALDKSGHAKDTIVVYSSDNGLAVGQHGLLGKQNLYEHSLRVPLVLRGPEIPRGRTDALVYLHDLFATISELADVKTPEEIDSQSLAPVIRGERTSVRDHLLGAYRDVQRSVRDKRWKLIEYRVKGESHTQLFDVENDPHERTNLADVPAQQENLKRLKTLLRRTRRLAHDPVDF